MNWLEDLFFCNLSNKLQVYNILLKIPEEEYLGPLINGNVSRKFFITMVTRYQNMIRKHLSSTNTKDLKEIITGMKKLIMPDVEMENTVDSLYSLFKLSLVQEFNKYFNYIDNHMIFEKQTSKDSLTSLEILEKLLIKKSVEAFLLYKKIIETKFLNTKVREPLFINDKVMFALITESGGAMTIEQLPPPLRSRMKAVLSHAEYDFAQKFIENERIQQLVGIGSEHLAPNFKEKMRKIIEASAYEIEELDKQELVNRLKDLFVAKSVEDSEIVHLAENVQSATIDGRILLCQLGETLSSARNTELNKVLRTILQDPNHDDLPNMGLTSKECTFALAMEAITASSSSPKNIFLNVYGKSK